jgi:hypothetical protein
MNLATKFHIEERAMPQDIYPLDRIEEGAHLIPGHMVGAVRRYIMQGIPPGSFLTAVLCNDLREAFSRADDDNSAAMRGWVQFLYNYAPSGCWGSPDRYAAWLAKFREQAA